MPPKWQWQRVDASLERVSHILNSRNVRLLMLSEINRHLFGFSFSNKIQPSPRTTAFSWWGGRRIRDRLRVVHWSPGWGLVLGLTTLSYKKKLVTQPQCEPRNDNRKKRRRIRGSNMNLEFGTWNVRSAGKSGSLRVLLDRIQERKLGVTAIQETRLDGDKIWDTNNYTIVSSGKTAGTREGGVSFILDRRLQVTLLNEWLSYTYIN